MLLDGVWVLGFGYVIVGVGFGRVFVLYGVDVLNIWKLMDWEYDMIYVMFNVGMCFLMLDIGEKEGKEKMVEML